ncbi:MAG: hypothetical protein AAGA31_13390, partial [Bacteroidota bacterium]
MDLPVRSGWSVGTLGQTHQIATTEKIDLILAQIKSCDCLSEASLSRTSIFWFVFVANDKNEQIGAWKIGLKLM